MSNSASLPRITDNCLVRCETSSVSSLARSRTQPLATSPQYSHWRGGGGDCTTCPQRPPITESPSQCRDVVTMRRIRRNCDGTVCGQLCWHLCSVHQTNIPIPIKLSLYSFAMRTRYSALFLRLISQTVYLVRMQYRNMFNERSLITNSRKTWHQQNHWPHFVASRHNCSGKSFPDMLDVNCLRWTLGHLQKFFSLIDSIHKQPIKQ